MESSRAIRKCVQQVVRHRGESCHVLAGSRQILSSRPRIWSPTPGFGRAFGTTIERSDSRLDGTEAGITTQTAGRSKEPSQNSSPSSGGGHLQRNSRSPVGDRPRRSNRYPSDADRIDLSTIPGMPSSYRPPNRPDEATAQAKLRSLLGAVAPKPSPDTLPAASPTRQPSRVRRAKGEANEEEEEEAFVLPSLDAYRGRSDINDNTQSRGRNGLGAAGAGAGTTQPFDIADLIAEIDKPNRSALNFLSGTMATADQHHQEVLRLRSTLGRTVNVTPATGFDLTRAFRQLEIKCNQNNVRRDEIKQRFHVRRGQKAKIDRRQRWRVVFKEGFLAECARIRRMKAQGW